MCPIMMLGILAGETSSVQTEIPKFDEAIDLLDAAVQRRQSRQLIELPNVVINIIDRCKLQGVDMQEKVFTIFCKIKINSAWLEKFKQLQSDKQAQKALVANFIESLPENVRSTIPPDKLNDLVSQLAEAA